jgi:dTDP-3-amino-3,4,6-trideoxy-alpha-D-glucose transaminase
MMCVASVTSESVIEASASSKGGASVAGAAQVAHRRAGYAPPAVPIPLFDTETPLRPLRAALRDKLTEVLDRGRYVLGPEVAAFEQEFAQYLGVKHVVGVANGTDAITIALRALGIRPGDEVITPSFTFYATVEAAINAGATPVFCDVDPGTRNVSRATVERALTPNTKAIIAVDLFGLPAPVDDLRELGIPVLEDAAQAAGGSANGRRAGALGDIATFSFYPSKNLGAFGDGGVIATDDDELAELARALRFHGSRDKKNFQYVGYNSRLDELQAALLRVLLPHLDGWAEGRRAAAAAYAEHGLAEHAGLPTVGPGIEPAWHLFVVTHPDPDRVTAALADAGIQSRSYYRTPVHRQPAMAPYATTAPLEATEALARTNLALPMSPVLSAEQVAEVVRVVAQP